MSRTYLSWIDDDKLLEVVELLTTSFSKDVRSQRRSKVNSIASTPDMLSKAFTGRVPDRKANHTYRLLQMLARDLHERILCSCDGWDECSSTIADVENNERAIFVKLATSVSSWNTAKWREVEGIARELFRENYNAYYIIAFMEEANDPPPSDFLRSNRFISMTGDQLYSFVTGVDDAKQQLFRVLPTLINEYLPGFVFLSYSRKNATQMILVRDALRGIGINVWTDENLTPGTSEWTKAIQTAIRDCSGLVVILSPHAMESEWVNNEIMMAKTHKKRIFGFIVEGDISSAVPISLIQLQLIDATASLEAKLARLTTVVKDYLRDQRGL